MKKKVSRNEPCPCGSGKKYKNCCIHKGFEWIETEDGEIERRIPLSPDAAEAIQKLLEFQRKRLGREPENIFEGAPPLEHIEHMTVEAMKAAGVDPALIYAYEKTDGLLLNTHNENMALDSDIAEWEAAIDEYEQKTDKRASKRRLDERDLKAMEAIFAGSPEESPAEFVKKLPFPPPFTKEEWGKRKLSSIIEEPKYFEYFQRCLTEITTSGRARLYLNMFCMMANSDKPPQNKEEAEQLLKESLDRKFSTEELHSTLESLVLTCQPNSGIPYAAAAFELLGFIGDFMNAYAEQNGSQEDLSDVLEKVNGLALFAFVAAVNAELGIQPDTWGAPGHQTE